MAATGWLAVGQVLIQGQKKADIQSCRKASRTAVNYLPVLPHAAGPALASVYRMASA